jgi:hypothetical protein
VTTSDGFQIQFPPSAVTETTIITYRETAALAQPPPSSVIALRSFTLEARTSNGQPVTQFLQPFTIIVTYTDAQVAALGISESSINLAFWNGNAWVPMLPCAGCDGVDPVNNRVTVVAAHFTEFALTGQTTFYLFLPFVTR